VASVPFLGSALFSRAEAAAALPITVANDTGRFPDSAITMYVVGTEAATGRMGYVKNSGQFSQVSAGDNGGDGYLDLGVPLSSVGKGSFVLPKMSGRIYFAIDGKLRFKAVVDGDGRPALQYPVAWTEGDPNFDVLHDCCEFTFNDQGMFCNTTQVDMFSIPMAIRLRGGDGEKAAGDPAPGSRDRIFDEMRRQPGFERLVIGDNRRIVAPGHAIGMGRFPANYFDGYIGEIWDKYAGTDLRVRTMQGSFTGRVTGGQLTFTGGVRSFARPSTKDVLFCDGALLAPNDSL
jgi:hypothetical protein